MSITFYLIGVNFSRKKTKAHVESSNKNAQEAQGHLLGIKQQKGLDKQSQNHFTVMQAAKGNRNLLPGLQGENL
ncbi:hypothetical protein [Lentibacillus amyloliquefaciens]|uniref:Uncharacterized protein n=1 Tax=Lentibacillus amyloliquefaciens TaxID=1472767 RepID=A0A0U3W8U9_9BACI|nr:hypothetical protein [Lentibacillus amyloliquefaciens]ALX49520.1 hypothetical protein AOX59_13655 [Lentibacillus amyloliquefaciens]